jgi:hypothetical protein
MKKSIGNSGGKNKENCMGKSKDVKKDIKKKPKEKKGDGKK